MAKQSLQDGKVLMNSRNERDEREKRMWKRLERVQNGYHKATEMKLKEKSKKQGRNKSTYIFLLNY